MEHKNGLDKDREDLILAKLADLDKEPRGYQIKILQKMISWFDEATVRRQSIDAGAIEGLLRVATAGGKGLMSGYILGHMLANLQRFGKDGKLSIMCMADGIGTIGNFFNEHRPWIDAVKDNRVGTSIHHHENKIEQQNKIKQTHVTYATYQTASKEEFFPQTGVSLPHVIFVDEAHKSSSPAFKKCLEEIISKSNQQGIVPIVMYLTATPDDELMKKETIASFSLAAYLLSPYSPRLKIIQVIQDTGISAMEKANLSAKLASNVSFLGKLRGELNEILSIDSKSDQNEILTQMQYNRTRNEIRTIITDKAYVNVVPKPNLQERTNVRPFVKTMSNDVYQKYLKNEKPSLMYVSRTKLADAFAQELNQLSGDPNFAIAIYSSSRIEDENGEMDFDEGDTELYKKLKMYASGKYKIAISVGQLLESVNLPDTYNLFVLRNISSSRVYLQILGRSLRGGSEKQVNVYDYYANMDLMNVLYLTDDEIKIMLVEVERFAAYDPIWEGFKKRLIEELKTREQKMTLTTTHTSRPTTTIVTGGSEELGKKLQAINEKNFLDEDKFDILGIGGLEVHVELGEKGNIDYDGLVEESDDVVGNEGNDLRDTEKIPGVGATPPDLPTLPVVAKKPKKPKKPNLTEKSPEYSWYRSASLVLNCSSAVRRAGPATGEIFRQCVNFDDMIDRLAFDPSIENYLIENFPSVTSYGLTEFAREQGLQRHHYPFAKSLMYKLLERYYPQEYEVYIQKKLAEVYGQLQEINTVDIGGEVGPSKTLITKDFMQLYRSGGTHVVYFDRILNDPRYTELKARFQTIKGWEDQNVFDARWANFVIAEPNLFKFTSPNVKVASKGNSYEEVIIKNMKNAKILYLPLDIPSMSPSSVSTQTTLDTIFAEVYESETTFLNIPSMSSIDYVDQLHKAIQAGITVAKITLAPIDMALDSDVLCTKICTFIKQSKGLKGLDLSNNALGNRGLKIHHINQIIESSNSIGIKVLGLENNKLIIGSVDELLELIVNANHMMYLGLGDDSVGLPKITIDGQKLSDFVDLLLFLKDSPLKSIMLKNKIIVQVKGTPLHLANIEKEILHKTGTLLCLS